MKTTIGLCLMVLLFSTGCTQMVEDTTSEISLCMEKCSKLCELAKENNVSLEGFDQIKLEKKTGSVSVSCSCPCLDLS